MVGGSSIRLFHHYQVLVNEEGSARLEWTQWQQFTALPQGAVNTAKDIYVARDQDNKPTQLVNVTLNVNGYVM